MRGGNFEKTTFLGSDEIQIHVLRTDPKPVSGFDGDLLPFLPWEERGRYLEFELEERRREFLWSRLLARWVLESILNRPTKELKFSYEKNGKPFLEGSEAQFSLSHTEGLVACSVALRRVGIDVEKIPIKEKGGRNWDLLARRFFSADEKKHLFSRAPEARQRVFYEIFTLKEAIAKADGRGLGWALGCYPVPLSPGIRSTTNGWECFTTNLEPGGFCLGHMAEDRARPARYRFFEWTEESLREFFAPYLPALTEGVYGNLHR